MKRSPAKKNHERPVDWFYLDSNCINGSEAMLLGLRNDLKKKASLVDSLLNSPAIGGGVKLLLQQAESLENTIEVRTTNMFPENEGAWFRKGMGVNAGPFGTDVDSSPILSMYQKENVRNVKTELRSAFDNYNIDLKYINLNDCLWEKLLRLNIKYRDMNILHWDGINYRVDQLPDGLDVRMLSGNLSELFQEMRSNLLLARKTLDNCFQRLYRVSNQLWLHQEKSINQSKFKSEYNSRAQKIREQIADKRKARAGARPVSLMQREAYRYFGLEITADLSQVKRKYRELAKKLHPDSAEGSPEKFRYLTVMYQTLCD